MDKIIDKAKKLTLSFDAALPYNREELLKQFAIENLNCDEKTATKFSKIKLKQDCSSGNAC